MMPEIPLTREQIDQIVRAMLYEIDIKDVPLVYQADLQLFREIVNYKHNARKAILSYKEQNPCES